MPIPFLLAGGAALAAGVGAKKGFDGVSNLTRANQIVKNSDASLEKKRSEIDALRIDANDELRNLGQLKVDIFNNQINYIIEAIKTVKDAGSKLENFNQTLTEQEYIELKRGLTVSVALEKGIATGAAAGALTGMGAYGSVGLLASASTGTAISTLSGAAAKSATLAWLGGGSLASGGLGMAGGTMVLGGIVTGPALAITGLHLASKGEEALTEAREHEARNEQNMAAIDLMKVGVRAIITNALEVQLVLLETVKRFEKIKVNDNSDEKAFETMLAFGKSLKNILDQPILDSKGQAVSNLRYKLDGYITI